MKIRKMNRERRNRVTRSLKTKPTGGRSGVRPRYFTLVNRSNFGRVELEPGSENKSCHYDNCWGHCGQTPRATARLEKQSILGRQMLKEIT